MKTSVTIIVIVALLAVGAGWSNHYLNMSTTTLVQKLDQVEEQVKSQDWEEAASQLKEIENAWGVSKNVWSALVTHQEIDSIDITLKRLEEYIQSKNITFATCELGTFRLLVEHIADSESFNLTNIL